MTYPDFPRIMAGLLAEGTFRQENTVFKNVQTHMQGLRELVVTVGRQSKKSQSGAAAKVADAALIELLTSDGSIVESFEGPATLFQELAPLAVGKGGGRPDQARGAAPYAGALTDAGKMVLLAEELFELGLHGLGPDLVAASFGVDQVRHHRLRKVALFIEEGRGKIEVVDRFTIVIGLEDRVDFIIELSHLVLGSSTTREDGQQ